MKTQCDDIQSNTKGNTGTTEARCAHDRVGHARDSQYSWVGTDKSESPTNSLSNMKGQLTFLFDRVPGLSGGTQTPSETNYNLHATSEKG